MLWNGIPCTTVEYNIIKNAIKDGCDADAINIFTCTNDKNMFIFSPGQMETIYECIKRYGGQSPETEFFAQKADDSPVFSTGVMSLLFNCREEDGSMDFIYTCQPPKNVYSQISAYSIRSLREAYIQENLPLAEIKKVVSGVNSRLPPYRYLPNTYSALFVDNDGDIGFSQIRHDLNQSILKSGLSNRLSAFVLEKNRFGDFKYNFPKVALRFTLSPEAIALIDAKRSDGNYIFDTGKAFRLLEGFDNDISYQDMLKLAVTDESGYSLFSECEIKKGVSTRLSARNPEKFNEYVEALLKEKTQEEEINEDSVK